MAQQRAIGDASEAAAGGFRDGRRLPLLRGGVRGDGG
jgi:hypothetical protein